VSVGSHHYILSLKNKSDSSRPLPTK